MWSGWRRKWGPAAGTRWRNRQSSTNLAPAMLAPRLTVVFALALCSLETTATTTETTDSTEDLSTILTTDQGNYTTTALEEESTTPINEPKTPFTIRVQPLEEEQGNGMSYESIPAQLSHYIYEVKEGDLQDIGAEESNNNIVIRFDPQKFGNDRKNVQVTSFVADSDTAMKMEVEEAVADVRNRSGGADMISAFFVAPEDEVFDNKIDRKKAEERGDIGRDERYEGSANHSPQGKNSLTDEILAPLQAAVSLSHDESHKTSIEKQMIKEMPVYKTYIEIQKSIPFELKEEALNEEAPQVQHQPQPKPQPKQQTPQTYNENSIVPHVMFAYQIPQPRTPIFYRYPMYYIPQSYIGNYIMRHSYENTGVPAYFYRPRPVQPQQYYYLKYPTSTSPLLQQTPVPNIPNALPYKTPYTLPAYSSHHLEATPEQSYPESYQDDLYQEDNYHEEDQNTLHSEPVAQVLKANQSPQANQLSQSQQRAIPFRPSQHVFSSVYPPYTYKVPLLLKGRGLHARSVRSKELCIEYGGFKPPMVPSVQIDETALPQEAKEKSAVEEKSDS